MALPSLAKTWQFNVNQVAAADATLETQSDTLILLLKNLLKHSTAGFTNSSGGAITPTGGMVVKSSCNGAGAFGNGDDVDRWTTVADLVHAAAGNNHSWLVGRMTGVSSLYEVLIDLSNINTTVATIIVSHTGFGAANGGTDGTATAAPTASSSVTLVSNAVWGPPSTAGNATRLHYLCSSDGAVRHLVLMRNSNVAGWWFFMKPDQAQPWWTTPWIGGVIGTSTVAPGSNTPSNSNWTSHSDTQFSHTRHSTTTIDVKMGCTGFNALSGADFTQANPDGNNPMFGARALSNTTLFQGDHAFIPDLWLGRSGLSNGSGYPNPGPSQFVQLGPIIIPWNQSVIQLT